MTKTIQIPTIQNEDQLFQFALHNMKTLAFNKDGFVGLSKKHGGYIYEGDSRIPGIRFETSWTHQKNKFDLVLDLDVPEISDFYQDIKKENDLCNSLNIDVWKLQNENQARITFKEGSRYTARLIEEFSEGIVGYSNEDL